MGEVEGTGDRYHRPEARTPSSSPSAPALCTASLAPLAMSAREVQCIEPDPAVEEEVRAQHSALSEQALAQASVGRNHSRRCDDNAIGRGLSAEGHQPKAFASPS